MPPGVRVLSLRDNPAQQWADLSQAAMDRLKNENEALLKRLKELEESGATAAPGAGQAELVPRESLDTVKEEKEELEAELKQKEKRLLRLKQVRPACCSGTLILMVLLVSGLHRENRRVQASDRLHPRRQARILPERPSPRYVDVRPQRRVRVPARGW